MRLSAAAQWKTSELLEMLLRNYDFAPRRLTLFSAAGSSFVFVENTGHFNNLIIHNTSGLSTKLSHAVSSFNCKPEMCLQ